MDTNQKVFSDLDSSLKKQHRQKTLNDIRNYFRQDRTIDMIKGIINRIQDEQSNIVKAVFSELNDTCTALLAHAKRFDIIEDQIKRLTSNNIKKDIEVPFPDTNNPLLKNYTINNNVKNISDTGTVYSSQINKKRNKGLVLPNYKIYHVENTLNTNEDKVKCNNKNDSNIHTTIDEITQGQETFEVRLTSENPSNRELKLQNSLENLREPCQIINNGKQQILVKAQIHTIRPNNFDCVNNTESSQILNGKNTVADKKLDIIENSILLCQTGLDTLQNKDLVNDHTGKIKVVDTLYAINKTIGEITDNLSVNREFNFIVKKHDNSELKIDGDNNLTIDIANIRGNFENKTPYDLKRVSLIEPEPPPV